MKIFVNKFQPIQYINKTPYLIFGIVEIPKVENKVTEMKDYLGCDTAFKNLKENVYYFCNEIKEIEFEEL